MNNIKKILIDFDGVLTDGKVYYTHDAKQFKGTNSRDIRAIKELISNGFEVIIITASKWPGATNFANKTGAEIIMSRVKKDYVDTITEPFAAIGDDVWDFDMLSKADMAFAPADCDQLIHTIPNIKILNCNGGDGVIATLVHQLVN